MSHALMMHEALLWAKAALESRCDRESLAASDIRTIISLSTKAWR